MVRKIIFLISLLFINVCIALDFYELTDNIPYSYDTLYAIHNLECNPYKDTTWWYHFKVRELKIVFFYNPLVHLSNSDSESTKKKNVEYFSFKIGWNF